ncbi:fimbrial protein [Pseudomonas sp. PDM13]|uniref:fimbrial protein n=1 Tax=Pseudomonas sp. PDM13 TaxID=2769255 RepID=UPI0021E0A690|nr:fimbrial protein [Pseudomonas sp. PDM13]MCU9948898.1 type 1 fimbrial protein [Pseudomonas sp. PDM13]
MSARTRLDTSHRAWLLGWMLLFSLTARSEENMHFHGALVMKPCVVASESERSEVNLGNIRLESLHDQGRTPGTAFALRLEQCDISAAKHGVRVTFRGDESDRRGMLTLAPGSQAGNIVIGLETAEGEALPLGTPSAAQALVEGENLLRFKAYAERLGADPQSAITPGTFSAVASFEVSYE